jgi:hypothetical protein
MSLQKWIKVPHATPEESACLPCGRSNHQAFCKGSGRTTVKTHLMAVPHGTPLQRVLHSQVFLEMTAGSTFPGIPHGHPYQRQPDIRCFLVGTLRRMWIKILILDLIKLQFLRWWRKINDTMRKPGLEPTWCLVSFPV